MDDWTPRAIPTQGAAETATREADDGHEIRADLFGLGARNGEAHRLMVTCEPLEFDDGEPPNERWPSLEEVLAAADEMVPGEILSLVFFANPEGVERIPVPPGAPRSIELSQVGEMAQPGKIEVIQS